MYSEHFCHSLRSVLHKYFHKRMNIADLGGNCLFLHKPGLRRWCHMYTSTYSRYYCSRSTYICSHSGITDTVALLFSVKPYGVFSEANVLFWARKRREGSKCLISVLGVALNMRNNMDYTRPTTCCLHCRTRLRSNPQLLSFMEGSYYYNF